MSPTFDDESCVTGSHGWFPIREVARLTGVNPVTLRAWERRYGLIVPRRTAKGHRLYDSSHVQRIRGILGWLDRGVAVSQVRHLMDSQQVVDLDEHNPWRDLHEHMQQAIAQLNERQLDDSFNRAFSLYPPRTLCEHLLLPLLTSLERRWTGQFGAELERGLFNTWLRTKLGSRLYHFNRQHSGAPLLLVPLGERRFEPGLWLCAWLVSSAGWPVEVIEWPVPLTELPLALARLDPCGLLLYGSQSLDSGDLRRQLPRLADPQRLPLLLAGPTASIHQAELRDLDGLILAADALAALDALQAHPLFEKPQGPIR
ncbi:MerR family transcriptional regulator [Stutzerimonas stutzeri]|uniref:MerR family transcriptional regulator n=1 Tax=Stutzerimonas stutzeri TaxID=316 RepID=UPI001C2E2B7F|nr:MerR family transcriptional regulator [Stutzerimonas stutzeri]